MKRPEYVAVVTRIYSTLLKEKRTPSPEELLELELAFSRQGFTDGYWRGEPGREMFGVRAENAPSPEELYRAAKAAYDREDMRLVPVDMRSEILPGVPAKLTVSDEAGYTAEVTGPVPEPARSRPLLAEEVRSRLAKTGGTAFRAGEISVALGEGLSLPASAVNALRREALDALAASRTAPPERREHPAPPLPEDTGGNGGDPALTVTLFAPEQLTAELAALAPEIVYLPLERVGGFPLGEYAGRGIEFCALLPRVCTDHELPALRSLLEAAKEAGCTSAAVQNLGQIEWARQMGFFLRGGYGLNIFNSRSLAQCGAWGLRSAALSFELRYEQVRDLRKPLPCEGVIYGRLPLMLTENCLISNAGRGCETRRGMAAPCTASHRLTDRRGEDFPVLPVFGCRSEVENSKILFLADKPEYKKCGLQYANLRFTTETPAECIAVMRFCRGLGGKKPEGCTRGLFYRGVE